MTSQILNVDMPKRFKLVPTVGGALEVVHAAQCVGYVWSEQEQWLARSREGTLLNTGSGKTVAEAVQALFQKREEHVLLKAQ